MATSYQEILTDLKKQNYRPVYVLHGQEAYYIDLISDYIESNVLSDGEKAFNVAKVVVAQAPMCIGRM